MAKAKVQPTPLELFEAAIPGASLDDLLELGLRVLEEGARRADEYANLIGSDLPVDIANEALAFVVRFHKVYSPVLSDIPRARKAARLLCQAEEDLTAAGVRAVAVDA